MARSVAFESSGRFMQAQAMEDRFADNLGIARVAVDRGKSRNVLSGISIKGDV
jgi:hypothetical protein